MKPLRYGLAAGLILLGTVVSVEAQGRGHGASPQAAASDRSSVSGGIHVSFSNHDAQIIREHYAPQYRNLPPGLQKKLARTGQLPPGWQKKMAPFPVALERQLVALPTGYQRGVIDGHAVIYKPGTSIIIDARVLF
jgi:hypothetical protein